MSKHLNFDFSDDEIIVDLFAGGGGASTGIEMALGRGPDIAINHDPEAIALHRANHPDTMHFINDVFELNPHNVVTGRPVGLLWLSPDCKHFSKAKGGKPKSKKIRSLAWVGVKWARAKRPRIICLENVEEFKTWGPLNCDGNACELRKGDTFKLFVSSFERLGYRVEWKELRACDYGAPTIRKRLFLIARCDGEPIVFPEPTHGDPKSKAVKDGHLKPWVSIAECLDFTLPAPSIFLTKEEAKEIGVRRPLSDNTMNRIAKGLKKYVIDAIEPFIVTANHAGDNFRGQGLLEPFKTITAANDAHGLVVPYLTEHANGSSQRIFSPNEPLRTQMAETKGGHFALVQAFLAQHNLGNIGRTLDAPISTITTTGSQQQLVTTNIVKMRGQNIGHGTNEPLHTITASGTHHAEVRAFLTKYYGTGEGQDIKDPAHTITTKDRFGLITIKGTAYQIVDIGMRMLTPRELFRAQGFPEDYKIDIDFNGKPLSKTAQIRMCGNSVCPPLAAALIKANFQPRTLRVTA
ncbi:DNA (cytosine-5-)-methyltransferase [Aquamicrobium sp.]|uniref:DNA (cytosine-5-)-methyltransferase n=1 Tax=Aquamicrobium sp. TaxID=1872579 RepID=UPI00258B011C|nr:DNA (cytosine-5-)-methyltransferase [Aquamicrobium sp.]MCK9549299.1 DNA (cytosine-5-)-methyltransferase [Aquamicrobium sp.]